MNTATFGVLTTPRVWHELPVEAWDAGAPRRERSKPTKTSYYGEERRVTGQPEFGLHPLEDVCRSIQQQARRIHDQRAREQQEREDAALTTATLYTRLQAQLGLYAVDVACDLLRISRDELTLRLDLATTAMMECA